MALPSSATGQTQSFARPPVGSAGSELVRTWYDHLGAGSLESARACMAPDFRGGVAHPINEVADAQQFIDAFWLPFSKAIRGLRYHPFVEVEGDYDGVTLDGEGQAGHWLNSTGYLVGEFHRPLLRIPPTNRVLYVRFAQLVRIEDGLIQQLYLLPDFVDVMVQAGVCPLRPALGHSGLMLPPRTMDGNDLGRIGDAQKSSDLVLAMCAGLARFDGTSLFSMDQEQFWHENFLWYGPGGIGASIGLEGFRNHHQGPFLRGFPSRGVLRTKSFVAQGDYVGTGGWPHMYGEHRGGGWLGLPPTHRRVSMRVMDFWRREGDLLAENWVSIDIPHVLAQMGLDIFEQVRECAGAAEPGPKRAGARNATTPPRDNAAARAQDAGIFQEGI